jgi:hypothetical protein
VPMRLCKLTNSFWKPLEPKSHSQQVTWLSSSWPHQAGHKPGHPAGSPLLPESGAEICFLGGVSLRSGPRGTLPPTPLPFFPPGAPGSLAGVFILFLK